MKSYDPRELVVLLNATEIKGWAEDTMLEIALPDNEYENHRDIHGNHVRIRKLAREKYDAEITFYLKQDSASNNTLTDFVLADLAGDLGNFTIQIKDSRGTSLLHANSGYVIQRPNQSYGLNYADREWHIMAVDITHIIGGLK